MKELQTVHLVNQYKAAKSSVAERDSGSKYTKQVRIIRALQAEPASQDLIDKIAEGQRRRRETQLRENGFWLGNLSFLSRHGEELGQIHQLEDRIAELSGEMIQQAARDFLDAENFVQTMLLPEAARSEAAGGP